MAKKQAEEVLTVEKLMQIGKETRKFVLATLSAEDKRMVVSHMRPEDRMAGLAAEEMTILMEQIEAFLKQQQSSGK